MPLQGTVLIPLRANDGSVRAWTLIDMADAAFVTTWRWGVTNEGYVARSQYLGKVPRHRVRAIKLHRELMGLVPGDGLEVDHVNRDRLDNRRSNLRVVSRNANAQNRSKRAGFASRYRGVSYRPSTGKWQASVTAHGKKHYLGVFTSEADAAEAARAARLRLMPYAVD